MTSIQSAQIEIDLEGRLPTPLLRTVVRDVAAQRDAIDRPTTAQDIDQAVALPMQRRLTEALPRANAYRSGSCVIGQGWDY